MFTVLTIKDKDYKLKLDAKSCIELEKKLGTNPLNILMTISESGKIPELGVLLTILHYSLQAYNHGFKLEDTYSLFDDFVEDGKSITDLIPVIVEIFKVSGFIKEDDSKNA